MNSFTLSENNYDLAIENITMDIDAVALEKHPSITVGDVTFTLSRLFVKNKIRGFFDVRRVTLGSSTRARADDSLATEIIYQTDLIQSDSGELNGLSVRMNINNLDIALINELSEFKNSSLGDPEAAAQARLPRLNELAHRLWRKT